MFFSFRVEVCINGSMKCYKLTGNMTREGNFESIQFLVEDPWSSYEFRVLTIWSDFNKAMDGLMGPRSTPVTPSDHCQGDLLHDLKLLVISLRHSSS